MTDKTPDEREVLLAQLLMAMDEFSKAQADADTTRAYNGLVLFGKFLDEYLDRRGQAWVH